MENLKLTQLSKVLESQLQSLLLLFYIVCVIVRQCMLGYNSFIINFYYVNIFLFYCFIECNSLAKYALFDNGLGWTTRVGCDDDIMSKRK